MPTIPINSYSKVVRGKRIRVKSHRRHLPIRVAHQLRPVDERIADERTTEELGTIDRWNKDPDKYDYPKVDTALPKGFKLKTETSRLDDNDKYLVLFDDKGKNVGEIGYFDNYDDPVLGEELIYLGQLEVTDKGKGYSNLLLREMTNMADREGKKIALTAYPTDDTGFFGSDKNGVKRLKNYYKQYGFKVIKETKHMGFAEMMREPQRKWR